MKWNFTARERKQRVPEFMSRFMKLSRRLSNENWEEGKISKHFDCDGKNRLSKLKSNSAKLQLRIIIRNQESQIKLFDELITLKIHGKVLTKFCFILDPISVMTSTCGTISIFHSSNCISAKLKLRTGNNFDSDESWTNKKRKITLKLTSSIRAIIYHR